MRVWGLRWVSPACGAKDSEDRGTLQSHSVSVVIICFSSRCIQQGKSIPVVPQGSYSHHKHYGVRTSVESCCKDSDTVRFLLFCIPLGVPLTPESLTPSPPASSHHSAHNAMLPSSVPNQGAANSCLCPRKRRSQDSGKSVFPGQPVDSKRSSLGKHRHCLSQCHPHASGVALGAEDNWVMSLACGHTPGA